MGEGTGDGGLARINGVPAVVVEGKWHAEQDWHHVFILMRWP